MRLAVVMTAAVLMTGIRAHADILVSPEVQESATTVVAPPGPGALEMAPVRLAVNPLGTLDPPASTAQLTANPAAETPEPSTIVMLGTGMVGVFAAAWRRRKTASQGLAASMA